MRISDAYRCVAFAAVLGFAGQAFAFDVKSLNADTSPQEALQGGLELYRKGDKSTAFEALNFAAEKGDPIAQWQAAKMLAEGDGVKQDDYKAFELFSEIADAHADDTPGDPSSRFVSKAFVALGDYYQKGIPNTDVKPDPYRARQIYSHAASIFGDPDAQYSLARMYFTGEGGERDPVQAARWSKLAADKGNVAAQALLGHLLFEGDDGISRQPVLGLMYLSVARERAKPAQAWIFDMQEQAVSVATEDERRTAMALADDWMTKYGKKKN
jgi:TPR repeat protein